MNRYHLHLVLGISAFLWLPEVQASKPPPRNSTKPGAQPAKTHAVGQVFTPAHRHLWKQIDRLKSRDWSGKRPETRVFFQKLGPGAFDQMILLARLGGRQMWYTSTAWGLAQWGKLSPKHLSQILQALGDKDDQIRMTAACALRYLGALAEKAVPALLRALKDPNTRVQFYASEALKKMKSKALLALPHALQMMQSENKWVRARAIKILEGLGDAAFPQAMPAILRSIQQDWHWTRVTAAKILAGWGAKAIAARPVLLKVLKTEESGFIRSYLLEALQKMAPTQDDIKYWVKLLETGGVRTRHGAAKALGQMGKKALSVVPALKKLAQTSDSWDAKAALLALRQILGAQKYDPTIVQTSRAIFMVWNMRIPKSDYARLVRIKGEKETINEALRRVLRQGLQQEEKKLLGRKTSPSVPSTGKR